MSDRSDSFESTLDDAPPEWAPRRSRGRRWLTRLALAILGVVLLGLAGAWWLLGTEAGHEALSRRASAAILDASGWAVTADRLDLDLDLDGGRILLDGIQAGDVDSPPFARVTTIEAAVLWRRLLADGVRVERVAVRGLTVDLSAPIPQAPDSEPTGEPTPFELAELQVDGARVVNGPAGGWLDAWTLDEIRLGASITQDGLVAALDEATLVLDRRADAPGGSDTATAVDPLSLTVVGTVRGPLAGPFTVDGLALEGTGVHLAGSATVGTGVDDPIQLAFVVDAEPGRLAPELAAGSGRLRAEGDLDLRRLTGTVELDADAFPPELLEPILGEARLDLLGARGTHLDAVAALRLDGTDTEAIGGTTELTWRRGEERLLIADAVVTPEADGIVLDVDARLLPDADGERRANGRLRGATWTALAEAPIENGRLRVAISDLVTERDRLGQRWPSVERQLALLLGELSLTGRLDLDARLADRLVDPSLDAEATWSPSAGSTVRVTATGRPIRAEGQARIELDGFDLAWLEPRVAGLAGAVEGTVDAEIAADDTAITGRLSLPRWQLGETVAATRSQVAFDGRLVDGRPDVQLTASIDEVIAVDAPGPLRSLHAELSMAESVIDRIALDGQLDLVPDDGPPQSLPIAIHGDGRLVESAGRTVLDQATAHIELGRPVDGVDRLAGSVRLHDGSLLVDLDELVTSGREHTGVATAHLPLTALGRLPGAGAVVETLPVASPADGPLTIRFDLPPLDTETWSRWLAVEPPTWRARGAMSGALTFDPDAPTRLVGRLTAREVEIESDDTAARAAGPLRLELADGAIRLDRSAWRIGEQQVELEGGAQLSPGWTFENPPLDLVESVELTADGTVPAAVAVPFLAGGTAEGVFHLDAVISGSPSQLDADVRVDGEEAAFTWLTPYFTRFEAPRAEVRVADGRIHVDRFVARWNGGEIELDGTVEGLDQIDLEGYYDRVRYRLDYGLSVLVSGNMGYRARPSEPAELSANVLVDRGSLRRDLAAGREVLDQLLAPPELELPPIPDEVAATRLAMQIATVDGIRVKNNLADLRVSWSPPLVVEGRLGAPRVFGEILVEPDGRLYAYGQVVRLDHAALRFSGDPQVGSTLDVEMTTSLEDPSIATPEDQQVLADLAQPDARRSTTAAEDQIADSLASGLTTYYGDQLASRLGQALGRTTVRYRPLWIFGESDPEARLVISQDLSKHFAIGVAFDLTDSEQEIYLLDVHDVPGLPSLSATVFTSADSEVGGTIQQRLLFGADRDLPEDADGLLLDEVIWSCSTCAQPDVLPQRAMRHAIGIERGDWIPEDVGFDSEIEVAEVLRRDGWTVPVVKARLSADDAGEEADLRIEITPGPRATFRFDGEPPPKRRRASIRDLYRGDVTEPASLVEMRDQALRVWRSLGHPQPEVEITVRPLDPARPEGDREVTIDSRPGPTVELDVPRFEGVPESVATTLAARFVSVQSRIELATATGGAADRAIDALRRLGYPDAEVVGQRLDVETRQPVVAIAAGDRRHLASVTVTGAPEAEAETIRALIPLDAGDPLLATELASATLAIERHLRQQGWNRAGVRVEVEPDGTRMAVEVQIEPGPRQRLVAVEVAGDPVTETRWVERLAGLETGGWLDAEAISRARRNLLGTGLFERVGVEVVEDPDSEADARVRFTLDERPRYQVSYGARWESDDGLGAVVDLFDRNVGGRGFGLGVRGVWVSDDSALRVYANHPRVFNSPVSLDLFVEAFEEIDDGLDAEGWETSAQLSWAVRPETRLRTYIRYRRADVVDTRLRTADRRKQRESTPVAGLQIYYDGRDDPLDPRRGLFTSFDLSGSENLLSGDDSYLRAFGQIDLHLPIPRTGGRLTWSQGLSVGYAEVYQGQLPRDERFFAGGSRSVRGYDSRSLGPAIMLPGDNERRALGGDASFVLNQELRFELSPTLTGIAFFDAGRVEADFEGLLDRFDIDDDDELRRSIGVGVRFRSPVGLLRLDLAHALDRREEDNDIEVYIGFGHAF